MPSGLDSAARPAILAAYLGLLVSPAFADGPPPPACAPTESYEICGLIVQRNNAENDLIHVQALRQREADYWSKYVAGNELKQKALEGYWASYIEGAAKTAALRSARAAEAAARR